MDVLHIEQPLCYQRHCLCSLELHERSDWRATAPDTHQPFSDTTLCAYTASPVHSLLFSEQLRTKTKPTYLMTAYYTPNDGFPANKV